MRKIAPLLAITAAAALFGAGCGGSADGEGASAAADAPGPAVTIKAFQFQPDPIEVEAGDTVVWTNEDATTHTVTAGTRKQPDKQAYDLSFKQGETVEHTYAEPGTYDYFCDLHSGPGMVGQVIVK